MANQEAAPYPETCYSIGLPLPEVRPPAQGRIDCDCCVVGGGLAGIAVASELAAAGQEVIVLENRRLGWGASGRNGGLVISGWAKGLEAIERRLGLNGAKALQGLSNEGVEWVRAAIGRLDPRLFEGTGFLSLARREAASELKQERDHLLRHYGETLRYLSRAEVQAQVISPRYHQGLYDPRAFHIHALGFCLALAAEAESLGARFCEHSPVIKIDTGMPVKRVRTAEAEITCRHLVLCGGGYGGTEMDLLARSYLPISTYIIQTEPLEDRLDALLASEAGLADRRRAGNYFRKRVGGRLLWGGDITAFGREQPETIARNLKRELGTVFPQLADVRIEAAWGGRMAYARHKMPIVGPLQEGLWACCGFGGHGLNTGPICARLVAEGITGASDRYRLLAPFGLSWNGGILGPLAAEAIFRGMKLRDAWQERRPG